MPRKKKAADAAPDSASACLRSITAPATPDNPGEFVWRRREFRVGPRTPESDALFCRLIVTAEGNAIDAQADARQITRADADRRKGVLARWAAAGLHEAGGDLWDDYTTGPCARVGLELYLQCVLEEFDPVLKVWVSHDSRGEVRRMLSGRCRAAGAAVAAVAPVFYALAREHAVEGGRPSATPDAVDKAEAALLKEAAKYGT